MIKGSDKQLEVCVDSVNNALTAQLAGAHRVEFCAGLSEGGITPSLAQIGMMQQLLHIQFNVLIRPRGGDFLYDDTEFEMMQSDIHYCGRTGCDGVVIGMLLPDGNIDKERSRELICIAHQYGMSVTFHRAFDRSKDLFQAMEDIIELGCHRILTSGGHNTAIEGATVIGQLITKANNRIIIMPGAGITPENAGDLIRKTGLKELHGTFRSYRPGFMQYRNTNFDRQDEEYGLWQTDAVKIKAILNHLA
ncbi:MAG: copper homeostasis protein CutC [Dysgonamonadaceae bacterium]|nr:copper homeostasis protein CutC [Dysgonamonadaceae bacterium]